MVGAMSLEDFCEYCLILLLLVLPCVPYVTI
jgi:hypothetical protein